MKPEPLKDKGRWANEDLCLEYHQCAVEKPELKEHLIELWHSDKDLLSAVEWLKGVVKATRDDMPTKLIKDCLTRDGGAIDQAFEDVVCKHTTKGKVKEE